MEKNDKSILGIDSIRIVGMINKNIYNIEDLEKELFNTFIIYEGEKEKLVLTTFTIDKVVKYINENKNNLWGV